MKKFICTSPCTFISSDHKIEIFDDQKKIFYLRTNKEGSIKFNLPIGEFYSNNIFSQLPFEPYMNYSAPKNYIPPSEFKIIITDNPKKATINIKNRTIKIDKQIGYHDYKPCIVFVLGHELYHPVVGGNTYDEKGNILFDAEKACDDFSKMWMLSNGYNPIQVTASIELILSDPDRKKHIHQQMNTKNLRR